MFTPKPNLSYSTVELNLTGLSHYLYINQGADGAPATGIQL